MTSPLLLALLISVGHHPRPAPTFAGIAATVQRGIRQGIYPGAVVVVGRRDTVLYSRGFGHLTWSGKAPRPDPESTRWDLASLTKVVATTSAVLVLVERGKVDLDAPVARYLPRFSGDGRDLVTVRMLLDHTSGLPAYVAFFRLAANRDEAIDMLYRVPLVRTPGRSAEYSDLNAMLLGLLVESVSGLPLDRFASSEVFTPLGMSATLFAPWLPSGVSIAPSWSAAGHPEPGRVNDQNSYLLGGVAGHAGLFSTGADLARYAQAWLRGGSTSEGRWASAETLQEFLRLSPASGSRALGWDTPERRGTRSSVYGRLAGAGTYGHTGWTGTMIWINPDRDLFLVFLTNRSLDPRARRSIKALRALRGRLSDQVDVAALR
jgi:CubicO group peptidase (beta-lactamase class C family)